MHHVARLSEKASEVVLRPLGGIAANFKAVSHKHPDAKSARGSNTGPSGAAPAHMLLKRHKAIRSRLRGAFNL